MKQGLLILFWLTSQVVVAQEICDNGIDDDLDGFIDCEDGDCFSAGYCPVVNDQTPSVCEDAFGTGSATVDLTAYQLAITGLLEVAPTISWYKDTANNGNLIQPIAAPNSFSVVDSDVVFAEVDNGTNQGIASVTFTVNTLPSVVGQTPVVCEDSYGSGDATVSLASLESAIDGGSGHTFAWFEDSGLTIPVGSSSTLAVDGQIFYAQVDDGTCSNIATATYTVQVRDDAGFSYPASAYCPTDGNPTPTVNTAGGTFSAPAGLVIDVTTGQLDLASSTVGTYTITYSTAGTCPSDSTFTVTIHATDDPTFSYANGSYCQNGTNPIPSVMTAGGSFVADPGLSIDPSTGEVDVALSPPGTYLITYTTAGACPSSTTFSMTINLPEDATFSYSSSAYCLTDINPSPSVNTSGGTFSSDPGITVNASTGEIDLLSSTPGTHQVVYSVGGTCPNSSTLDITVIDTNPPAASPATGISCDAFTAVWSPAFGASGYEVDVASDSEFTSILASYNAASTTDTFLNVSGLTAAQTYYYRVRSVSSCGTSALSATIDVGILDIPEAPTALTASNPSCNGFKVSWNPVAYASGYLLEVSSDGFTTTELSLTISSTSITLVGLAQGTTYEYRITPGNVCGDGPSSSSSYQTRDIPTPPTNLAASSAVCDGITLTWDEGGDVDEYFVEISADTFATSSTYPVSNNTLALSGLTSATAYAYRIVPGNTCGTGDTTGIFTFLTDSLPDSPASIQIVAHHNQAVVSWESVANAQAYQVEIASDPLFSDLIGSYLANSTDTTVYELTPVATYFGRVLALNSCGLGTPSDTVTFTTPQDPLVIDSLALVDLYNATTGGSWINDTNWLSGSIDSWQGVTVDGNRVVQIDLSSNQLSGSFPTSMSDLTALYYADFRNNELRGSLGVWVSNFSEATDTLLLDQNQLSAIIEPLPATPGFVSLSDNLFTFDDLIPAISSLSHLSYAPQAGIGSGSTVYRNAEASYTFSLAIDPAVADNQYVWFRDNIAVDTVNTNQYTLNPIRISDAGNYTCKVTNPHAPDLTIVSQAVTIDVQAHPNSITFSKIADVTYGSEPFVLNALATSGLPVYYEVAAGDSLVTLTGDMVTPAGIGVVTIRAIQPGDDFYGEAAAKTQQFTIGRSEQTIAFTVINDQDIAVSDTVSLAISASSGLPLDFTVEGPAEYESGILLLLDTGTVTLTANQPGNPYYLPALPVSQSFVVYSSDTIPDPVVTPGQTDASVTLAVQLSDSLASLSVSTSLYKATGTGYTMEDQKFLASGNGEFSQLPKGFYSLRLDPTDENYLPTYAGGQLILAQASVVGLTQDTTLSLNLLPKPDTATQEGVTVRGTLRLENTSNGRYQEEVALPNVRVYVVHTSSRAIVGYGITDEEGRFFFPNVPPGSYYFLADYEGLELYENQFTVEETPLSLFALADQIITLRVEEQSVITSIGSDIESSIDTYPNPVSDRLSINLPATWTGSNVSLADMSGKEVASQTVTFTSTTLSLGSLKPGLYHLRIRKGDQFYYTKVIKQ